MSFVTCTKLHAEFGRFFLEILKGKRKAGNLQGMQGERDAKYYTYIKTFSSYQKYSLHSIMKYAKKNYQTFKIGGFEHLFLAMMK